MPLSAQIVQQPAFDYGSLAACHRKAIKEEVVAIRGLLRQTAEAIVQIGLRLRMVRELLGANRFQVWLAAEFGRSQPTASRYMRVAAMFAELPCIKQFQPSAMYLLAQKRVGDSVRAMDLAQAQAGEVVTKLSVEQILAVGKRQASNGCRPLADKVHDYLARITREMDDENINELAEILTQIASELRRRRENTYIDTYVYA
jgi:hypothetical protein